MILLPLVFPADSHCTKKNFFSVHIKRPSFWPLADVEPMSSDLVRAKPWHCLFALSLYTKNSIVDT